MVGIPKSLQRWIRLRPRLRVGLHYGGAVLSSLTAALWVSNFFWKLTYLFRFYWISVERGRVTFGWHRGQPFSRPGLRIKPHSDWVMEFLPERGAVLSGGWIVIPLWIPLLTCAVVAFVAWRSHRNRPPHVCRKCEYDLTGNVSGVCPECGAGTQVVTSTE